MTPFSDDTTLLESEGDASRSMAPKSIPLSNYLWKSPDGKALPGWHHQLVLHLLAVDKTWHADKVFNYSTIIEWLRRHSPAYVLGNPVIQAIAAEYLSLDGGLKSAYRAMVPGLPLQRQARQVVADTATALSADLGSDNLWHKILDPALFRQGETEPVAGFEESTTPKASFVIEDSGNPIGYGDDITMVDDIAAATTPVSVPAMPPATNTGFHQQAESVRSVFTEDNQSARDLDQNHDTPDPQIPARVEPVTNTTNSAQPPTTPIQPEFTRKTPSRPQPKRVMPLQKKLSSTDTPTRSSTTSLTKGQSMLLTNNMSSVTDENALQEVTHDPDALLGTKQKDTEPTTKLALTPVTNGVSSASLTSITRRPDSSKYVEPSRGHFIVPASEATSFVTFFEEGDAMPDKVEGYFWYCDSCYGSKTNKDKKPPAGLTRGKFSSRKSIENHFQSKHHKKWTTVLPEPERSGTAEKVSRASSASKPASKSVEVHVDQLEPPSTTTTGVAAKPISYSVSRTKLPTPKTNSEQRSAVQPIQVSSASATDDADYTYRPENVKRKLFQSELGERDPTTAKRRQISNRIGNDIFGLFSDIGGEISHSSKALSPDELGPGKETL